MSNDPLDRWTEALRRWAARPTRVSPAAARARVLAELDGGRRSPAWRLAAAGATLAAGALALLLLIGRLEEPIPVQPTAAPAVTAAQRTIVHQLSSGTRMYIVFRPARPAGDC